jgi:hypothetical protein
VRKVMGVMYCVGILFSLFGYWGLNTDAGRHRYDEMDSLYPAMALASGVGFVVAAAAMQGWRAWRRRARR